MKSNVLRLKGRRLTFNIQDSESYSALLTSIATAMHASYRFDVNQHELADLRVVLDPIYATALAHIRIYDKLTNARIPSVPDVVSPKHLSGLSVELQPTNGYAVISLQASYPGMAAPGKNGWNKIIQNFNLVFMRSSGQPLAMEWTATKGETDSDIRDAELSKFVVKL